MNKKYKYTVREILTKMLTEKLFITDGELYNTMLNEKVDDHKIRLGGPYYYGKEQKKFFVLKREKN